MVTINNQFLSREPGRFFAVNAFERSYIIQSLLEQVGRQVWFNLSSQDSTLFSPNALAREVTRTPKSLNMHKKIQPLHISAGILKLNLELSP